MGGFLLLVRAITWIVDYSVLVAGLASLQMLDHESESTLTLAGSVAFSTLQLNILWYMREEFYFVLLGSYVSEYKRNYRLSLRDICFMVQTSCVGAASIVCLIKWNIASFQQTKDVLQFPAWPVVDTVGWMWFVDVVYREPSIVSATIETLSWFYVLLAVKDLVFMTTFHRLTHTYKTLYVWHRTHHEVRRNGRFQLAYHTDILNLLIEDGGAPILLWLLLYIVGLGEMRIPIYSIHLLTLFDGGIHSINPFTVLFWNPVVDCMMNANITHTIHHVVRNRHITTVPLHHLLTPGARKVDELEYDKLMNTRFFLSR
jgi:hypothetical protein